LHDWSDEHVLKILKNCYVALPSQGGKVIIMEQLMPVETPLEATDGIRSACSAPVRKDMLMLVICEGGRERSALEYDGLVKQAGFTSFRVVSKVGDSLYSIMEAHK
jgi:caffeic acid 3-O-methyltransferase